MTFQVFILMVGGIAGGVVWGQGAPGTTVVSDVVYSANGAPEGGILLISWGAFTTASGQGIAAGQTSAVVASNGRVSVSLVANVGAQPFGAAYKVVYKLADGTTHVEYWIVPVSASAVTIAGVRAQQLPASVAAQTVTRQYVDGAVASALVSGGGGANALNKTGDTMTGPLGLAGDPVSAMQAADKHYVDAQVAGATANVGAQIGAKLGRAGDAPVSLADVRYASQFAGGSVGAQMDAACADLAGARGVVVVSSSMGAGWSVAGVPDNCLIRDERGNGGSAGGNFYKGVDFYGRFTGVAPGLNIIQPLLLEGDAYAGGVNAGTQKTQYSGLRLEFDARTLGERKNVTGFLRCEGKGDCIGSAFWAQDWGGYGTSGDEGNEGGRFEADQADGYVWPVPNGTAGAVSGNAVAVNWVGGSQAYVGEGRPFINLSRGVYATGTITGTSFAGGVCTVAGSGTGWIAGLGAGTHQDLFLEIVGNDGPHLRWTVPVMQVVDDTHVVIEYNLAEIGATCLGGSLTQSGAYKIYRGGVVAALGAVAAAGKLPSGVNLAAGGSFFQSGDSVEEPVGYNYHGSGVVALLNREIGEPLGSGVYANNLGAAPFQSAFRASGAWLNGLLVDGTVSQDGLVFSRAVGGGAGALVKSTDMAAPGQALMTWLNGSGAGRTINYNRTGEVLSFPGGQYFSTNSAQIGVGTNPVAGSLLYLYNGTAGQAALTIPFVAGAGPQIQATNGSGIPTFKLSPSIAEFDSAIGLKGYSDNGANNTWQINSVDGSASFAATSLGNTSVTGKMNFGSNVSVNDNSATGYGVGLNAGGLPGISFQASGATRKFGMFQGTPGNSNGTLQFWDWTANQSILSYDGTKWSFPQGVTAPTAVTADNSTNVATTAFVKAQGYGTGTVTSVGLSTPGVIFSVGGSPVTSSGALTLNLLTQTANTVFAGPASGPAAAPGFRALAAADVPAIAESQVTNLVGDLGAKAALASPAFTGTPTAPTATVGTNTTQVATTAFVLANAGSGGGSKWSGTSFPGYSVVASATRYFALGGSGNFSSSAGANVAPGWAGTLKNFCVYLGSSQPAGGALTITALVNNSASALTVSFAPGTSGVQCDTTHSATLAATDLVSVQAVNGSTSAAGVVQSVTAAVQ